MGAGISAGAFAEGFYKGYSLIEKSMADKEERELKRKEQERKTQELDNQAKDAAEIKATGQLDLNKKNAEKINEATDIDAYNKSVEVYNTDKEHFEQVYLPTVMSDVNIKQQNKDILASAVKPNLPFAKTITVYDATGNPVSKDVPVPSLDAELQTDGLIVGGDGLIYQRKQNDKKEYTNEIDESYAPIPPVAFAKPKTTFEDRSYAEWKKDNPDGKMIEFTQEQALAKSTETKEYMVDGQPTFLTKTQMIDMVEKGNNVKPMPKIEAPQPYSLNGKTVMLTATQYSKLSEKDKKSIKPYEAPKDNTGSWTTTVNPVTGDLIQTNTKTGATRIGGNVPVKPSEEEVKHKEVITVSKQVTNYLNAIDKTLKTNPNAVGSLGSGVWNFIGNKVNSYVKKPTKDRLDRATIEQFATDSSTLLAKANQSGVLSNQDINQAQTMIPTVDDSPQEIAKKTKSLRIFLDNKIKENKSQLTPAVKAKIERENPTPTVIKIWSDAQYEYRKLSNGDIQKKAKK